MDKKELVSELGKISVVAEGQSATCGVDFDIVVPKENLVSFADLLYGNSYLLVYVSAVHLEPEMAGIYEFVSTDDNTRVRARVFCGEDKILPSISNIFHGAGWYEREVMEFFGLDFEGNEDKRTLILPDSDKGLNPLLKKEGKLKTAEDTGLL